MALVKLNPVYPDPEIITRAAQLLRGGRLVAFPTETVYGLGANALDARSVARIYAAKGRPKYNPLIVHVADVSLVPTVAAGWNDAAERLSHAFWPGPLTLVLPNADAIPGSVRGGPPTLAARVR